MWRPRTHDDLMSAIGVVSEGAELDFKRELASGAPLRDLAKDVAAMSIDGGVIVIGVDEDDHGTAAAITRIPLAGAPERIQQVIDSRVRPPVNVELDVIRAQTGDDDGVLVVVVAPSLLAPHMYENRYPARSGAVTRWLEEPEVARLYERRRDAIGTPGDEPPLARFLAPEGAGPGPPGGIGSLAVHVAPLGAVAHPAAPRLGAPLRDAARRAGEVIAHLVDPYFTPVALDFLGEWRPRGSRGWKAGVAYADFPLLVGGKLAAATFRYAGDFSFLTTIPLVETGREWRCAYEHLWAAELLGDLAIAGSFFAGVPGAGVLRCGVRLSGLRGAVSWRASEARAISDDMVRVADHSYVAERIFAVHDLCSDPRGAVRELLDPFFVSFVEEGYDVVGRVRAGG